MSKTLTSLLAAVALVFSGCELLITEPPVDEAYYYVSYHGNGSDAGTTPSDYSYYHWGDPVGVQGNTGDLSRAGYTFAGWNTSPAAMGTTYLPGQSFAMPDNNVDLYAIWAQNFRAIHFEANGGSGTMVDQAVAEGVPTVLSPVAFTRSGYLFSGWNTTSAGTGTGYTDQATVTVGNHGLTLYAIWTPSNNTVSFQANGGTGTMAAVNVPFGTDYTLPTVSFTKTGHHFTVWSEQPSGGALTYTDQQTITMPNRSFVLYARWAPNTYKVTFHANGGTGTMQPQSYTYGSTQPLPPSQFSNGVLRFSGWSDTPGGPAIWSDEEGYETGASDRDLYALWSSSVSIAWENGSALTFTPSSTTVAMGQSVVLEAAVAGASNWRWYVDNERVANQSTGTFEFTPSTPGFHTVSVLVTANGMTLSGNIIVRVNQ